MGGEVPQIGLATIIVIVPLVVTTIPIATTGVMDGVFLAPELVEFYLVVDFNVTIFKLAHYLFHTPPNPL